MRMNFGENEIEEYDCEEELKPHLFKNKKPLKQLKIALTTFLPNHRYTNKKLRKK